MHLNMAKTFPCRVGHPRVVLRKGHRGLSFYFIFSGSAFVNVEEELVKTGHVTWHTAITLQRGDSFGVRERFYQVLKTFVLHYKRTKITCVDRL